MDSKYWKYGGLDVLAILPHILFIFHALWLFSDKFAYQVFGLQQTTKPSSLLTQTEKDPYKSPSGVACLKKKASIMALIQGLLLYFQFLFIQGEMQVTDITNYNHFTRVPTLLWRFILYCKQRYNLTCSLLALIYIIYLFWKF